MNETKTIKRTFAPMLWLNLFFGIGLLDLKPNLLNKILEYAYTVLSLILLNGMLLFSWSTYETFNKNQIFNHETMFFVLLIAQLTVMNVMIIVSRINAQKLRKILRLIEAYDRKMEKMGLASQHRTLLFYQIKIISLHGIVVTTYYVVMNVNLYKYSTVFTTIKNIWATFLQIMFEFSVCVSYISFCIWIKYFRIKFQQMNQLIRGFLTTTPDSPQHKRVLGMQYDFKNKTFTSFRNEYTRGRNANVHVIRTIKQRHLELIKIARMMNASYGIQIMMLTTISFVFTICFLYISYRILWLNSNLFFYQILPFFYYILYYLTQICYENHVCAETCAQATEMGDIICELYEPSASKEFRMEIQDFTLQLIQNPLMFTGYGFFELGHSFIQETVGSITTYLVILIQVGDMSIQFTGGTSSNSTENGTSRWQVDDI